MKCPRCRTDHKLDVPVCSCGFCFQDVSAAELPYWFEEVKAVLESAYTAAKTPWQQSGFSGPYERWVRLRIPIAECVNRNGTFLDIGCANGFLLECLMQWTQAKGVKITPYGLDCSHLLIELARQRLPDHADHLFVGNAWDWSPPFQFDYVRTELVYVPGNLQKNFVERLLSWLTPGGALLLAHYRSRREDLSQGWFNEQLREWGFPIERSICGFDGEGRELTRVAVLNPLAPPVGKGAWGN